MMSSGLEKRFYDSMVVKFVEVLNFITNDLSVTLASPLNRLACFVWTKTRPSLKFALLQFYMLVVRINHGLKTKEK